MKQPLRRMVCGGLLAALLPAPAVLAGDVFQDAPPPTAPPAAVRAEPWEDAPATRPAGRIIEVKTARGMVAGRPLGVSRVFPPEANPIYVWFRFQGVTPGSRLSSRWYYLETHPPHPLGGAEVKTKTGSGWSEFNYELAPGKKWPLGRYRVDLHLNGRKAAEVSFGVQPAAPRAQATPQPQPDQTAAPKAQPVPKAAPAWSAQQPEIEARRQAKLAYTQALDEFNAGRYQNSVRLFQRYLAVFPQDGQAQKYLALAQAQVRAAKTGTLKVTSVPPAQVFLDGRPLGRTPLERKEVPVGRYRLQAREGGRSQSHDLVIKPRTTTSVEFDLRQRVEVRTVRPPANQYRHPRLGFALAVPPGWKVDERESKADLRLRPTRGQGLIQVNSNAVQKNPDPQEYLRAWEREFFSADNPLQKRVSGRPLTLLGRPAYEAVYQGGGAKAKLIFLSTPRRFYVLSGIFLAPNYASGVEVFDRMVNSFRPGEPAAN